MEVDRDYYQLKSNYENNNVVRNSRNINYYNKRKRKLMEGLLFVVVEHPMIHHDFKYSHPLHVNGYVCVLEI